MLMHSLLTRILERIMVIVSTSIFAWLILGPIAVVPMGTPIVQDKKINEDISITITYDPPNGYFSQSALAVYAHCSVDNCNIYYALDGQSPSLDGPYIDSNSRYFQIDTPFRYGRLRNVSLVAIHVHDDGTTLTRSRPLHLHYFVEGAARPSSYAFMVPGVESGGYFIGVAVEMNATLRAQLSTQGNGRYVIGVSEFADFTSTYGMGTYKEQVKPLRLTDIDPDITGFEGGFAVNTTSGRQYGVLVPYHNGRSYIGKVVRIDLEAMVHNVTHCLEHYRIEHMNNSQIVVNGTANATSACVHVIDVASLNPRAKGFMKGFANYPYAYLAPGRFNVPVRLDMDDFGLHSTSLIDLGQVSDLYGGYSGGFADGSWACFAPYRTYYGAVGGIRSSLPVDATNLRSYYHSLLTCINATGWSLPGNQSQQRQGISSAAIVTADLSEIKPELRGFSGATRVGRYAYFSHLQTSEKTLGSQLVRLYLGEVDVGSTLSTLRSQQNTLDTVVSVLDLSHIDPSLRGYSDIFACGTNLMLVPARNVYTPLNGNRGDGVVTRVNMNSFDLTGVDFIDLTTTQRAQTPYMPETGARGFVAGVASGQYGLLFPFYNGLFSGTSVRMDCLSSSLDSNVQVLNLRLDRNKPDVYKGYRGGFLSLARAVWP